MNKFLKLHSVKTSLLIQINSLSKLSHRFKFNQRINSNLKQYLNRKGKKNSTVHNWKTAQQHNRALWPARAQRAQPASRVQPGSGNRPVARLPHRVSQWATTAGPFNASRPSAMDGRTLISGEQSPAACALGNPSLFSPHRDSSPRRTENERREMTVRRPS
jgi:hypothetical protein